MSKATLWTIVLIGLLPVVLVFGGATQGGTFSAICNAVAVLAIVGGAVVKVLSDARHDADVGEIVADRVPPGERATESTHDRV